MTRRSRLRRSRRHTVVERAGLTEEAVDALRERGLLSRVVRLPAPALGAAAPVSGVPPAPPPALAPAPSAWPPPPPAPPQSLVTAAEPVDPPPDTAAEPVTAPGSAGTAESTVLRPRRHDLVLDDGRRIRLTAAGLVVGRRPSSAPPAADPNAPASPALRLEIDDPRRSLSRDHARLDVGDDGVVLVVDLGSANGTTVHRSDGSVTELVPGRPLAVHAGDALHLGDTVAHLQRSVPRRRAPAPDTAPPCLPPAPGASGGA